ncbi:WSC domain-containing protein [Apiosordaria backusii]|uniref:WSC domain-containing protein n=1 Tax=Apiosordaria backusii TaxID=314023 RepID=A0AA40DZS3_9PEZI|nr:WSC domain-containing protein [Apiosordaria backusii]
MHSLLALAALVPAVVGQTFYGCYTEIPTRALTGASTADFEGMTIEACETYCTDPTRNFTLWGLEYGGECYCGNSLGTGSFPAFPEDCSMACTGDAGQTCGGPHRISLYGIDEEPPVHTPYPHPEVTAPVYEGCWTELPAPGRALAGGFGFSPAAMTTQRCADYCLNSGFTWFGLQYMAECFCGPELDALSTQLNDTDCDLPCTGDAGEVCGGSSKLSVYQWV